MKKKTNVDLLKIPFGGSITVKSTDEPMPA